MVNTKSMKSSSNDKTSALQNTSSSSSAQVTKNDLPKGSENQFLETYLGKRCSSRLNKIAENTENCSQSSETLTTSEKKEEVKVGAIGTRRSSSRFARLPDVTIKSENASTSGGRRSSSRLSTRSDIGSSTESLSTVGLKEGRRISSRLSQILDAEESGGENCSGSKKRSSNQLGHISEAESLESLDSISSITTRRQSNRLKKTVDPENTKSIGEPKRSNSRSSLVSGSGSTENLSLNDKGNVRFSSRLSKINENCNQTGEPSLSPRPEENKRISTRLSKVSAKSTSHTDVRETEKCSEPNSSQKDETVASKKLCKTLSTEKKTQEDAKKKESNDPESHKSVESKDIKEAELTTGPKRYSFRHRKDSETSTDDQAVQPVNLKSKLCVSLNRISENEEDKISKNLSASAKTYGQRKSIKDNKSDKNARNYEPDEKSSDNESDDKTVEKKIKENVRNTESDESTKLIKTTTSPDSVPKLENACSILTPVQEYGEKKIIEKNDESFSSETSSKSNTPKNNYESFVTRKESCEVHVCPKEPVHRTLGDSSNEIENESENSKTSEFTEDDKNVLSSIIGSEKKEEKIDTIVKDKECSKLFVEKSDKRVRNVSLDEAKMEENNSPGKRVKIEAGVSCSLKSSQVGSLNQSSSSSPAITLEGFEQPNDSMNILNQSLEKENKTIKILSDVCVTENKREQIEGSQTGSPNNFLPGEFSPKKRLMNAFMNDSHLESQTTPEKCNVDSNVLRESSNSSPNKSFSSPTNKPQISEAPLSSEVNVKTEISGIEPATSDCAIFNEKKLNTSSQLVASVPGFINEEIKNPANTEASLDNKVNLSLNKDFSTELKCKETVKRASEKYSSPLVSKNNLAKPVQKSKVEISSCLEQQEVKSINIENPQEEDLLTMIFEKSEDLSRDTNSEDQELLTFHLSEDSTSDIMTDKELFPKLNLERDDKKIDCVRSTLKEIIATNDLRTNAEVKSIKESTTKKTESSSDNSEASGDSCDSITVTKISPDAPKMQETLEIKTEASEKFRKIKNHTPKSAENVEDHIDCQTKIAESTPKVCPITKTNDQTPVKLKHVENSILKSHPSDFNTISKESSSNEPSVNKSVKTGKKTQRVSFSSEIIESHEKPAKKSVLACLNDHEYVEKINSYINNVLESRRSLKIISKLSEKKSQKNLGKKTEKEKVSLQDNSNLQANNQSSSIETESVNPFSNSKPLRTEIKPSKSALKTKPSSVNEGIKNACKVEPTSSKMGQRVPSFPIKVAGQKDDLSSKNNSESVSAKTLKKKKKKKTVNKTVIQSNTGMESNEHLKFVSDKEQPSDLVHPLTISKSPSKTSSENLNSKHPECENAGGKKAKKPHSPNTIEGMQSIPSVTIDSSKLSKKQNVKTLKERNCIESLKRSRDKITQEAAFVVNNALVNGSKQFNLEGSRIPQKRQKLSKNTASQDLSKKPIKLLNTSWGKISVAVIPQASQKPVKVKVGSEWNVKTATAKSDALVSNQSNDHQVFSSNDEVKSNLKTKTSSLKEDNASKPSPFISNRLNPSKNSFEDLPKNLSLCNEKKKKKKKKNKNKLNKDNTSSALLFSSLESGHKNKQTSNPSILPNSKKHSSDEDNSKFLPKSRNTVLEAPTKNLVTHSEKQVSCKLPQNNVSSEIKKNTRNIAVEDLFKTQRNTSSSNVQTGIKDSEFLPATLKRKKIITEMIKNEGKFLDSKFQTFFSKKLKTVNESSNEEGKFSSNEKNLAPLPNDFLDKLEGKPGHRSVELKDKYKPNSKDEKMHKKVKKNRKRKKKNNVLVPGETSNKDILKQDYISLSGTSTKFKAAVVDKLHTSSFSNNLSKHERYCSKVVREPAKNIHDYRQNMKLFT